MVKGEGIPPCVYQAFGPFICPLGAVLNGVKGGPISYPRGLCK